MTSKLNWQTASDKDKIQTLIEHVLGLSIVQQRSAHAPCAYYAHDSDSSLNLDCWVIFDGKMTRSMRRRFNPLVSIEDAMLLVEAMKKREDFFALVLSIDKHSSYAQMALLHHQAGARCQDVKDAICKASLQVLGLLEEEVKV